MKFVSDTSSIIEITLVYRNARINENIRFTADKHFTLTCTPHLYVIQGIWVKSVEL